MAIEFKRNKKTGEVEAYRDGKKIGKVTTFGDEIIKETSNKGKDNGKKGRTAKRR